MVFPATALTDSNREPANVIAESLDTFIYSSLGYFSTNGSERLSAPIPRGTTSIPFNWMECTRKTFHVSAINANCLLGVFATAYFETNVKGTLRGPLHIRRSFKTTIVRQFGLVVAAPDAELADAWPISRPYLSPLKKICVTAGVPSFADEAE